MSDVTTNSEYEARVNAELATFKEDTNVHDLPEIFHYWSNKFIRPKQELFGFSNPEQFFMRSLARHCEASDGTVYAISIGSGNCDTEARIASELVESGIANFVIECLEINSAMIKRGREEAARLGVQKHLKFSQVDFNVWEADRRYDVVIANQSLHHVLELEHLFDEIATSMDENSVFLTSDMIGRNGHQRWPEALDALQPFWEEIPRSYRFNRIMARQEATYINHDCSSEGFEGIRAQEVLPLLIERFQFELFIPFANLIMVFIDRPFGHNFDAEAEFDRHFIDRVHAFDEASIMSGSLKPTQMLASLRISDVETKLTHPRLTPEFCVRRPYT